MATNAIVSCEVCLTEIPKSVARSYEGPDYVYYFCGGDCYQKWQAQNGMREIALSVRGAALDFEAARRLADLMASGAGKEPMLLAWFDRRRGLESPQAAECTKDKPGWFAYAVSHGGNVKVDINQGEYVFVYATGRR